MIKIEIGYIMSQDTTEPRVTIDNVASLSGYSKATVSRVINKEGSVKPATVAKIEEAIQKLGYTPNSFASALSGGKSRTVAVLLPEMMTEYYAALLTGLEAVAEERDYNILLKTRNNRKALNDLVASNKVDAFILRNTGLQPFDNDFIVTLKRREIPFLFIGKPPAFAEDSPAILVDNVGGARQMASHYAEHRFSRILFIAGPKDNLDSNDRLYGFKLGLNEAGVVPEKLDLEYGDYSRESGYAAARIALEHGSHDAIFAANDHMALGAILRCREMGIDVPDDIAVTGFDDTFFSEFLLPPLTTVRQPMSEIGAVAMETILQLLERGVRREYKVILPTRLQIRQSCGCGRGGTGEA
jgi:DNA-binding LacI/PurR family transcriptional regulator